MVAVRPRRSRTKGNTKEDEPPPADCSASEYEISLDELRARRPNPVSVTPSRNPALLPLGELEPEVFERLVAEMIVLENKRHVVHYYGRRGQQQHGLDIYEKCIDGKPVVYQVKRYQEISPAEIRRAVVAYAGPPRSSCGSSPKRRFNSQKFVLVTSARFDHERRNVDALNALEEEYKDDLDIDVWGAEDLSRRLREHRTLVSVFFGSAWAKEFCGRRGINRRAIYAVCIIAILAAVVFIKYDGQTAAGDGKSGDAVENTASGSAAKNLVAGTTSVSPVGCRSGWVIPNQGNGAIPYSSKDALPDAVVSSGAKVAVTVQGTMNRSVILESAEVEIVKRASRRSGVYLPLDCQAGVVPRAFSLDLNSRSPEIVPQPGTITFPYRVNEVEPEVFWITPELPEGEVEWRLHINWTSGAEKGELVFPQSGKPPFRVAGTVGMRKFCFDRVSYEWKPEC
ncbi:hypothetical protein [Pseudofrankia sp. BMG5.37]|uniref:hypothetical protein n=1 Tax=Pseudofrankia sp. BMG5.37 TaxID=3050035 RepID=UPI00289581FA|nr:hypothetical protein [Pseudofrankia sp. BMG5.37]MDT3443557.1 hypothetical protein [Pseudofrankia sp. BMG5.37]